MGKKTPSAPAAPDPATTAAAQGQWNSFTAQQQQSMNMVGQNTPWGTLDYTQSGTTTMVDPSGKTITVPRYTANVGLSASQKEIFDKGQEAESNLAGLAADQSAKLAGYLDKPFEYNNEDAEKWAYGLGSKRLDPRFAQQEDALRTQLVNSGIRPGTPAYDREMSRLGETKNDAYNNLALTSRGQSFGEALTTRNQPLNEITALMSGSQVSNPAGSFAQTPQSQVAGVDYTGLVNQQYQGQMANWQAQMQNKSNAMGGLFGLGGSILGAAGQAGGFGKLFSDRRLKKDISRVGTLDNGLPIYVYRMKSGGPFQLGLMAQDVAEVLPDAVEMDPSGFLKVGYELATGAV